MALQHFFLCGFLLNDPNNQHAPLKSSHYVWFIIFRQTSVCASDWLRMHERRVWAPNLDMSRHSFRLHIEHGGWESHSDFLRLFRSIFKQTRIQSLTLHVKIHSFFCLVIPLVVNQQNNGKRKKNRWECDDRTNTRKGAMKKFPSGLLKLGEFFSIFQHF